MLSLGTRRPCLVSLVSLGRRTMASQHSPIKPTIPRPSASLILVNSQNEVLLVHRTPTTSAFAGVHAFPGGNFDSNDVSPMMTAIRENFEETGILLASSASGQTPNAASVIAGRRAVHAQQLSFSQFLTDNALSLQTSLLHPFTQWITPPHIPRCALNYSCSPCR
jgi:8-oxo-dGTP pyrophosphatase MutT (NUDIX family)